MSPNRRRQLLREILSKKPGLSQDELAEVLLQAGVSVTQATVSRDLAFIGAVRGPRGYRLVELAQGDASVPPGKSDLFRKVYNHVISVDKAHSIVVVKTAPGHAQMVASAFDKYPLDGVVGTVAGDDTIFLATTGVKSCGQILEALNEATQGGRM